MTKYRIAQKGKEFRVEIKHWWGWKEVYNPKKCEWGIDEFPYAVFCTYHNFDSEEEAEDWAKIKYGTIAIRIRENKWSIV